MKQFEQSAAMLIHNFDNREYVGKIGREAWGYVEYNNPLTKEQIEAFDFVAESGGEDKETIVVVVTHLVFKVVVNGFRNIHNHIAVLIVGLELNINRFSHFRNQRPHELIRNVKLEALCYHLIHKDQAVLILAFHNLHPASNHRIALLALDKLQLCYCDLVSIMRNFTPPAVFGCFLNILCKPFRVNRLVEFIPNVSHDFSPF